MVIAPSFASPCLQARVVGLSTSSAPHPVTALPFDVDSEPPTDTRIRGVKYGPGARTVNVTMMRGRSSCGSPASADTHGWRFTLDGKGVSFVFLIPVASNTGAY